MGRASSVFSTRTPADQLAGRPGTADGTAHSFGSGDYGGSSGRPSTSSMEFPFSAAYREQAGPLQQQQRRSTIEGRPIYTPPNLDRHRDQLPPHMRGPRSSLEREQQHWADRDPRDRDLVGETEADSRMRGGSRGSQAEQPAFVVGMGGDMERPRTALPEEIDSSHGERRRLRSSDGMNGVHTVMGGLASGWHSGAVVIPSQRPGTGESLGQGPVFGGDVTGAQAALTSQLAVLQRKLSHDAAEQTIYLGGLEACGDRMKAAQQLHIYALAEMPDGGFSDPSVPHLAKWPP